MIRLLIAEDSTTVQRVLMRLLSEESAFEIVGIASDGEEAVRMCKELRPDLVTMDIFMPKMNGLEATRIIMTECPTRIVIVSSMVNSPDSNFAFEAMRAGAIDVIEKPVGILSGKYNEIKTELLRIIQNSIETRPSAQMSWLPSESPRHPAADDFEITGAAPVPPERHLPPALICIGGSTGAPTVIVEILSQLPSNFPIPIIVAQHISKGFADRMAEWLDSAMALEVRMANEHSTPLPGTVLICPDDRHLSFSAKGVFQLHPSHDTSVHIPSIDLLFSSVAVVYGAAAVGVLLSGMGKDGAEGLLKMRRAQSFTLGQNEETSVVYGMNRVAREIGAVVDEQPPLGIAAALLELGKQFRR